MKVNPAISIIMPCLNSAQHIAEAVDSVLAQSFTGFELIAVDSGSTDGTLDILNNYAAGDARVQILHSEKKSMGAQYNIGLDAARGNFIGFVESDDYIVPDMFDVLHRAMSGKDIDYVKSNFDMFVDLPDQRLFYAHGPIAEHQREFYGMVLLPQHLCELVRRDIFIWNGLYRLSFITENNIRFQETPGAAFQDAGFVSQVLMNAKNALYLDESFYRYRKGNSDASSSSLKTHRFVMDEFIYVTGKMNKQTEDLFMPAFLRRYFGSFHNCLRQNLSHYSYTDELSQQTERFRKQFIDYYNALTFPQLSRSDLWPPQALALFVSDFERYCTDSLTRYNSDGAAHLRAAEYLAEQSELVICGIGENAASVYCYLTRYGLRNVAGFCADTEDCDYYGKKVLPIRMAAKNFPSATFIVTQSVGSQDKLKHQLTECGISSRQVVYYGLGLFHHNWHELPLS